MGFQFAETMAGTIEWDESPGVTHPFKFEVTAHAESTRTHLRDGRALLRGIINAPPRVNNADAEGVITIRPVGQKIIRYEMSFIGDDGTPYELVGQKDIRFLSPLRTFTYLPAEILDEDHRRVATCKTSFNLRRDWWSFLRSFRPL
ncbi:MAG: hypothetical protein SFX73_26795 [Kofleriaceae bacterium]|nr:hypothetical protein [Kofleriaceae bacterium]